MIPDDSTIEALLEMLTHISMADRAFAILNLASHLRDSSEHLSAASHAAILTALLQGLRDEHKYPRAKAIASLADLRPIIEQSLALQSLFVEQLSALGYAYLRDTFLDWEWAWMIEMLGEVGDRVAISLLTDALSDERRLAGYGQRTVGEMAADALAAIEQGYV